MPALLMRLNNVPDDELDEVRALLTEAGIEFYETAKGTFGTAVAGIWLQDNNQMPQAKELLKTYQDRRGQVQRQDYQARLERGEVENFFQRLTREPVKVLLAFIAVALILYFSIVPLLSAWG